MATTTKLTKKQKKAIAFREGKSGKTRKNAVRDGEDGVQNNEVPLMDSEAQESLDAEGIEVENGDVYSEKKNSDANANGKKDKGKGRASDEPQAEKPSKKRKRDSESVEQVKETAQDGDAPKKKKKGNDEKQRFILFVGNLKYTTSVDAIKDHFSVCDPPPSVRLLTQKSASTTTKSKGCAFLEFTHRNALQQGLKMHHSQLEGRSINVELTAGGGGKSDSRLQKVKERNKKLDEQRNERQEKGGESTPRSRSQTQRYSATSGIGAAPDTKKTWTVGDADDGMTHRGGKKNTRKERPQRKSKLWGTGVNAIPVG